MSVDLETWGKNMAQGANRLYGRVTVTYQQVTDGAYDPTTGKPAETITSYPLPGYPAIIGKIEAYDAKFFGIGLIIAGDRKLSIAAADLVAGGMAANPEPNDKVSFVTETAVIISVERVYDGAAVSEYVLQVR